MTATNHVLAGSVLALSTATLLPWWAILPLAFLLHFTMDMLPHYGQPHNARAALSSLKWFLPLDALVGAAVLTATFVVRPDYWPLIVAAGILCASPDLWSMTRFIRFLKTGDTSFNKDWFAQFHHKIQWGERLWGVWIEAAWFGCFGFVFLAKLQLI